MLNLELKAALKNNRLYQSLEPQELDLLLAHSKLRPFSAGELILKQGGKSGGLYLVLDGKVTLCARIVGEGNAKLAMLTQGRIFGGSSVISQGPHPTSVFAETAVQCLFIPEEFLEMLAVFYPGMRHKIMRELAIHIGERITILTEKISKDISGADMIKRPIFSEMIKSLSKPSPLQEAELQEEELQKVFSILSLDEMLSYGSLIKTTSQSTLIQEGEGEVCCYLVLKGAVQSSLVKQNKLAKISILGPLSLFCPLTLINPEAPSLIQYASYERAVLLKLDQACFDEMQKKNLKLWYRVFDALVESWVLLGCSLEKLDIRINSEIYNR